jgi:membrane-bound lytic murein transglycosylase B
MAWDDAGTSGVGEAGGYPPGPARTRRAGWAGVVFGVAVLAVGITAITVWVIHLQALAAQVGPAANDAPQVVTIGPAPGTAGIAGTAPAGGGSASPIPAGSASPLDRVDHAWAARAASATGIPDQALLAYASADLTIAARQPGCGVGWNTLAAIATVESANGTYDGTTLLADGYTSKPIIGVPLDGGTFGGEPVAAIPDTDHGKLDGDTHWDHAVGPFQFLPSTWAKWGTDGNGDGTASPNQIDDAATGAARYLCASGTMTTTAGWRAAVFSYNQSDSYVNEVVEIANRYAADVSGLS